MHFFKMEMSFVHFFEYFAIIYFFALKCIKHINLMFAINKTESQLFSKSLAFLSLAQRKKNEK